MSIKNNSTVKTVEIKNLDTEKVKEVLANVLAAVNNNKKTSFSVSLINLANLVRESTGISFTQNLSKHLQDCVTENNEILHYKLRQFFENENKSVITTYQKVVEQLHPNCFDFFFPEEKSSVFLFLGFCGNFFGSVKLQILLNVSKVRGDFSLEILKQFAQTKQSFFIPNLT